MENTENKSTETTETKSVSINDTVSEILKTEVKSLEEKLRTEITAEVKTFYNQLPVVKDETIEVKKDRKELNKGFNDFISKAMTSADAVLLPHDYRSVLLGTNQYGALQTYGFNAQTDALTMRVPVVTDLPTVYTMGESNGVNNGVTGSSANPQDLQITLKRNSCKIPVTKEFLTGCPNVLQYFEQVVPEAFAFKFDYNVWNGTDGIYSHASSSFVQMTNSGSLASALNWKDLVNMKGKLPKRYLANAKWYVDGESLSIIEGLVTSGSTQIPLFSTTDGTRKLLGYEVVQLDPGVQNAPTVSTSNTPYFSFGDMSSVWNCNNGEQLELLVDTYSKKDFGIVEFMFTRMQDKALTNPSKAFVTLKSR